MPRHQFTARRVEHLREAPAPRAPTWPGRQTVLLAGTLNGKPLAFHFDGLGQFLAGDHRAFSTGERRWLIAQTKTLPPDRVWDFGALDYDESIAHRDIILAVVLGRRVVQEAVLDLAHLLGRDGLARHHESGPALLAKAIGTPLGEALMSAARAWRREAPMPDFAGLIATTPIPLDHVVAEARQWRVAADRATLQDQIAATRTRAAYRLEQRLALCQVAADDPELVTFRTGAPAA